MQRNGGVLRGVLQRYEMHELDARDCHHHRVVALHAAEQLHCDEAWELHAW